MLFRKHVCALKEITCLQIYYLLRHENLETLHPINKIKTLLRNKISDKIFIFFILCSIK